MDEDIPLPVDLPAAELNWAQCRVSEFQAVMTAFEGWTSPPAKSGMSRFHPLRTLDSPRLPLMVEQPSSGIPPACQTKTERYGAYAGDAAKRSSSLMISTANATSTGTDILIFAGGQPRQLTPMSWRLFTLLYRRRGTVVSSKALLRRRRENLRQLRKVLAGSRYEIVNHRDIGYELIVTPEHVLLSARPVPPKSSSRPWRERARLH
jgi:hypothetical protein